MKNLFFILSVFFGLSSSAQIQIGGVELPERLKIEEQNLILNGAGVREKFWMDMYVAGLYLESESSRASSIMKSDAPMAIKLHIVSKMITSKRMIDAVDEGFEDSTNGDISAISDQVATFKTYFEEKINKDDIFDLVFIPSEGVKVYKNGSEKGTLIGLEFKQALFGIWLSDKPADEDLKEAMLGR